MKTAEWERETELLIAQKKAQANIDFAEYELRPIGDTGGFEEHAVDALGFDYEDFGMRDTQAVACRICGGLYKNKLWVIRRHRLQCGWSSVVTP